VIGPLIAALFMSSWALFIETKPRVSCRCLNLRLEPEP
jgi:hypothetical protein